MQHLCVVGVAYTQTEGFNKKEPASRLARLPFTNRGKRPRLFVRIRNNCASKINLPFEFDRNVAARFQWPKGSSRSYEFPVRATFLDEALIDLIALPDQYVYRFPTAEGASTLSPKAADSAAMARQPVQ
jgi:hypothetical protein